MKYNIHINQIKIVELAPEIEIKEAVILDYLILICNSLNEKIISKRKDWFTWINYTRMISDLPLLRIKSKWAITPKIKNLEKYWFIKTKMFWQDLYIQLTEAIEELFLEITVHKNEQNRSQKWTVNRSRKWTNNNTINNNNKNNINSFDFDFLFDWLKDNIKENIKEFIEHRKQIKKKMTDKALKMFIKKVKKFIKDYWEQQTIQCIEKSIELGRSTIFEPQQLKQTYKNQYYDKNQTQRLEVDRKPRKKREDDVQKLRNEWFML